MFALSALLFVDLLGCPSPEVAPVQVPAQVPATVIVRTAPAPAPAAKDPTGNSLSIEVSPDSTRIAIDAKKKSN